MNLPTEEYLKFAQNLVLEAGKIALSLQNLATIELRKKHFFDFATNADLKIEKYLISAIKLKYPTHNILAEEKGIIKGSGNFRWVMDPLDATWNYKVKLPKFAILLALEKAKEILVAVAYLPASNELFSASKANGAFLNGKKIQVSPTTDLKKSFTVVNQPTARTPLKEFNQRMTLIRSLALNSHLTHTTNNSSIDLLRVAQGAYDGLYSLQSTGGWWDRIVGILMVKEAGGKVTTPSGEKVTSENFRNLVASNGKIHNQLLKLIKT